MRTIGITLAAAALAAGCARLPPAWSPTAPPAPETADTVLFLERLAGASPAALADMPASEPAPPERSRAALRHALWLATPDHAGHDPGAAERALQALLERETLAPPLQALVRLQLRELRARRASAAARARLERENARLREQIRALTDLERRMGDDDAAPAAPRVPEPVE